MARVVIVSTDRVAERMAGPAIRCLELTRALTNAGHPAFLAVPQEDPPKISGVEIVPFKGFPEKELFQRADVAIIPGSAHLSPQVSMDIPLIIDLYDPFLLSGLDLPQSRTPEGLVHFSKERSRLEKKIRLGNLFLTASKRQRDYWLGMLTAWGRIEPEAHHKDPGFEKLLAEVPVGISDTPPQKGPAAKGVIPGIEEEDELLLWGGGIWNWFDPLTLIKAVHELVKRRPTVRLLFMGVRHPNPLMPEMAMAVKAQKLASDLSLENKNVFFGDWVPYEKRGAYLLEADLGVSTHLPGIETRFAFRTRLLDCIWAGLPIITTQGDLMAEIVQENELGEVVPPCDSHILAKAIEDLLKDSSRSKKCAASLTALSENYRWSKVIKPIIAFCQDVDDGKITPRISVSSEQIQIVEAHGFLSLFRKRFGLCL